MSTEILNAEPNKPSKPYRKLVGIAATVIFIAALFFGFQWYQTKQYTDKIMPLYRSFEVLVNDQEKIYTSSDGKLYKDLISESDRIKKASQDLKLRLAEIQPSTNKATEIHKSFLDALDGLIDWSELSSAFLHADLETVSARKMLNYLDEQSSRPYIGKYMANEYNKQVDKFKEADSKKQSAEQKYTAAREAFSSNVRPALDKVLGVTATKN